MKKHKTKEEWIHLFNEYENGCLDWSKFHDSVNRTKYVSQAKLSKNRNDNKWRKNNMQRFIKKYKSWKILDNDFMNKTNKRPKKRDDSDIPSIIDDLNDEQKKEILERWIKEQRDKKNKKYMSSFKNLSISLASRISGIHRTTFYKTSKTKRVYKFDFIKEKLIEIHNENKMIYGSRRLSILLEKNNISIGDRTLRNYMSRWNIKTKTRVSRKKSESKNTNVKYCDLVKRNFNPVEDNIVATDVSYIAAATEQNNVYLSVVISHKTKMIEAWELNDVNDTELVIDTLKHLNRRDFILHSDHGSQYSTSEVQEYATKMNAKISMSRIGNSLDNREVEYFFGCLKGEYLNHIPTHRMSLNEIKDEVSWYINWYNKNRIQSRLQWKTPTEVSAYAI